MMGGTYHLADPAKQDRKQLLEQRRKSVKETLVTAVVFGLSLNMVADVLLSLPNLPTDPLFVWKASLGIFGASLTVLLFWYLLSMYLKEYRTLETEFLIALVWDVAKRGLAYRKTGYLPQMLLQNKLANKGYHEKVLFSENQGDLDPERIVKSGVPQDAIEAVLFMVVDQVKDGDQDWTVRTLEEIRKRNNIFLVDIGGQISFPGKWNLSYHRLDRGFHFKVKWKMGPLRSLEIRSELSRADWFEDVPDRNLIFDSFYIDKFVMAMRTMVKMWAKLMPDSENVEVPLEMPDRNTTSLVRTDFAIKVTLKMRLLKLGFSQDSIRAWEWAESFVSKIEYLLDWNAYLGRIFQLMTYQQTAGVFP